MSTRLDDLTDVLLTLPVPDRAELARQLIASLDCESTADHQAAWLEVARRRAAEILAGKVECASVEDALRRARESLK